MAKKQIKENFRFFEEQNFDNYITYYKPKKIYYFLNKKYNFGVINISKNATTFFKVLCLTLDKELPLPYLFMTGISHERQKECSYKLLEKYNLEIQENPNLDGFTKFMVWRDPIERFYSVCLNKHLPAKEAIRVLKEYIDENGECKDHHLLRQTKYYKDDVQYIVKLSDLDAFLKEVIGLPEEYIKHMNFRHYDVDLSLPQEDIDFLNEYYKEDYSLLELGKTWNNDK